MPNIGPIAYRDDQGIHWLQITIADNGVCTEFKQASEADMTANTWKTLEQDQWPTTIPAYDPSVSQSHFVLSRNSENKLIRHYFCKYTPPGPDQAHRHLSCAIPAQAEIHPSLTTDSSLYIAKKYLLKYTQYHDC